MIMRLQLYLVLIHLEEPPQITLDFRVSGSMEKQTFSIMNITKYELPMYDCFKICQLQKLVDSELTWRHRDASTNAETTNWQWNVPQTAFMLNVDVALYKVNRIFERSFEVINNIVFLKQDIQVDSDGKSSCDFDTCASAPTATAVEAFAASNDAWISEFSKVFVKMLAHGSNELKDLSQDILLCISLICFLLQLCLSQSDILFIKNKYFINKLLLIESLVCNGPVKAYLR